MVVKDHQIFEFTSFMASHKDFTLKSTYRVLCNPIKIYTQDNYPPVFLHSPFGVEDFGSQFKLNSSRILKDDDFILVDGDQVFESDREFISMAILNKDHVFVIADILDSDKFPGSLNFKGQFIYESFGSCSSRATTTFSIHVPSKMRVVVSSEDYIDTPKFSLEDGSPVHIESLVHSPMETSSDDESILEDLSFFLEYTGNPVNKN